MHMHAAGAATLEGKMLFEGERENDFCEVHRP